MRTSASTADDREKTRLIPLLLRERRQGALDLGGVEVLAVGNEADVDAFRRTGVQHVADADRGVACGGLAGKRLIRSNGAPRP